jgi:ribosomal protein L16 Arg81 hydroxylase
MIRRLDDLMAPLSEREFLDCFSRKRRFVVKTTKPERAASLLPWATINRLITNEMPASNIAVLLKGRLVNEQMYRNGPQGKLRPDALQGLAAQGVSIMLDQIHRYAPPIKALAHAIERRLSHPVHVNCYITFGTASAFTTHFDYHDVLIVQVHGAKRWRGYGIPFAHPLDGFPSKPGHIPFGDPIWEELIEPGDVLYVPRGEAHDAVGEVKPSVHLTIGIKPPTGIDLLNWIAQRAKNDAICRMDVSRTGGIETLRNHSVVFKQRLHELLDQLSFEAFLDDFDQQRSLDTRLNLGADKPLRPETWLSPTPKRRIALGPDKETEMTFGGKVFQLSAGARRALHFLLEEDGLSFGALAEQLETTVEDSELREAVAQLAAKGLVAIEP